MASCFASGLDGDGACGGESEQGVVVNIARITRSCLQPPSALNTPQSRVSFVTQNSSLWTRLVNIWTMMTSAMFVASRMMRMVVTKAMFRRVFAGLQIVIRGIRHRSIKSNVSTANKPTPMERTCLKLHSILFLFELQWKKGRRLYHSEEAQVEMKVLKVKWVCPVPP